jgi:uncharacterized protein (TIGR02270 family)
MFEPAQNFVCSVTSVVCEHLTRATQLVESFRAALLRSDLDYGLVEGLCNRCAANIDALQIAGAKATDIGWAAVEGDAEVAGVVALLLGDCEKGQPDASEQAAGLLHNVSSEIRQAAWWGLRLASCRYTEPHLRSLLGRSTPDFASAAALDILAFHRLPLETDLEALPDGTSDEVGWLLAEAGGRIPGVWTSKHLKQFLAHESLRVREAALRASARCGLPQLPTICREVVSQMNPKEIETIGFLGVVGSPDDLALLRRAVSDPLTATAGLAAIGRLGLPAGVPMLLEFLTTPETADCAAAAIERITGQQVPRGDPLNPPSDLTEDELDLWEPTAPVDVPRTNDWWKSNAARFDPNKRWQAGLCVSDDPLGSVFDQLPLGIRYDVYLRQRALVPGTPDWELETWTWNQRNRGR